MLLHQRKARKRVTLHTIGKRTPQTFLALSLRICCAIQAIGHIIGKRRVFDGVEIFLYVGGCRFGRLQPAPPGEDNKSQKTAKAGNSPKRKLRKTFMPLLLLIEARPSAPAGTWFDCRGTMHQLGSHFAAMPVLLPAPHAGVLPPENTKKQQQHGYRHRGLPCNT